MRKTLLVFAIFTCHYFLFAQIKTLKREVDPGLIPREHPLDFIELKLDLHFEPKEGLVKGKVTHIFTPLRNRVENFNLDAKEGLIIKEAHLNGNSILFKKDTNGYIFYPPSVLSYGNKYTLTINYEAKPKRGLYFIGWNDSLNLARKQIWSQGQATDNRYWIPMYDEMNDKVISEVNVIFNKDYKVLSNGSKISEKDNGDGTKTWKYRMLMPHSTYLIMLAIGKYEVRETKSKSGVPIRLYYYPDHRERVDHMYKYTERIMDFLEKETGVPYPWKTTYSQVPVADFMFGAMENTTATVFGDFYCVDARSFLDRSYVATNAHELAHMWFGDLITARSVADTWLQESFATHYQWLFDRDVYGNDHFDWLRRQANNEAITASQTDKKAVAHTEGGRVRWYPKGAFVLEMIKYIIGREQFNRVIKHYLEKNAYKNVDSNELLVAFQDVLGISLNWFFDQWIYKGGEPHYKVSYYEIRNMKNERSTEFIIEQIHDVNDYINYFKMPVKIEVYYKDGSKDTTIANIESQVHRVVIPNKNNLDIDFVLFDPNSQILKTVSFYKYQEELFRQALKAPYMLDRHDAVYALRNLDIEKKRETLISVYIRERFHAVKSEIIYQLALDTARSSKDLVFNAFKDQDVNVRKAVLNYVPVTAENENLFRKFLTDSSYLIVEGTLDKLIQKFPDRSFEYFEITKSETGNSGRNIRVKWLELQVALNKSNFFLSELIGYSSNSYEFRTRINAIEALRRINYIDEKLIKNLANAASHFNSRLSSVADQALQFYYKQPVYKRMLTEYYSKGILTLEEKTALKKNLK